MTSELADYSDQVTVPQLDSALRQLGFDGGVWHYIHGNFAFRIETPDVVNGIRALGWAQGGIDVPTLDTVSGVSMAAAARAYGFPSGAKMLLDIEPVEFNAAPAFWQAAADAWCDDIRHEGYVPVVYGTDTTLLVCASHADFILRAVPGDCDPTSPGLPGAAQLPPSFFAGRRANQCTVAAANGVSFDVSVSEFTLSVPPAVVPGALEDTAMVVHFMLPDGTEATFELGSPNTSRSVSYTRTELVNFHVLNRVPVLPGMWVTIERVGIWQGELFMRGTGVDGKLWQTTADPNASDTWTPAVLLA